MKKRIYMMMLLFVLVLHAQAQITFEQAKRLNNDREYLKAAEAFRRLQEQALEVGDTCLYMDCLLAEGEAAYMLDWTTTIRDVINKAIELRMSSQMASENDSINLAWQQGISKLKGSYYYCMTDIDETAFYYSEQSYFESMEYIEKLKDCSATDNPKLLTTIYRELLNLYYKYGAYESALAMAEHLYDYWAGYYNEEMFIDACISKAMVLAQLKRFGEAMECIDEIYDDVRRKNPYIERTKGKILFMQHDHDGSGNIEEAIKCYKRYADYILEEIDEQAGTMTDVQREQYWLNMSQFATDCYRLGKHAPELLYDIALYTKGYIIRCNTDDTKAYKWKDIRRALDKDECIIEFLQYKGRNEEEFLGALLLKPSSKQPEYIEIGSIREITQATTYNGYQIDQCINYDNHELKDALYSDSTLFSMVWTDELLSAIGSAKKVYFSPDGIIHQLAIEFMQPDERFESIRLSSSRTLLTHRKFKHGNMLLMGGFDYYAYIDDHTEENDVEGYLMLHEISSYISDLPGGEKETRTVYNMRRNPGDTILLGSSGTDDNFFALANSGYNIIHLSTHGYFAGSDRSTYLKPAITDNALSESGVLFAGSGKNLVDENFNPRFSDGILTAKEISAMELDNVDLIVLSACQTGLGHITADGVCGMQRALKQAGVSSMMLSLWSVSDYVTSLFMEKFYEELEKDTSPTPNIRKAFMSARKYIIEHQTETNLFKASTLSRRRTVNEYDFPRYTDAFILIDAF